MLYNCSMAKHVNNTNLHSHSSHVAFAPLDTMIVTPMKMCFRMWDTLSASANHAQEPCDLNVFLTLTSVSEGAAAPISCTPVRSCPLLFCCSRAELRLNLPHFLVCQLMQHPLRPVAGTTCKYPKLAEGSSNVIDTAHMPICRQCRYAHACSAVLTTRAFFGLNARSDSLQMHTCKQPCSDCTQKGSRLGGYLTVLPSRQNPEAHTQQKLMGSSLDLFSSRQHLRAQSAISAP